MPIGILSRYQLIFGQRCLCCTECTNSKSDQCTACLSGYTLDSGKCKINCVSNSNCLECDGNDNCIECQSGYFLQKNECKLKCYDGFYEKNGACLQCLLELNCQTCEYDNVNSKVVCLSCIQNQFNDLNIYYFIFDGICVSDCPNGYYNDGQNQCFECHTSCCKNRKNQLIHNYLYTNIYLATCEGPNVYNCLSCQNGQSLYKKQCLDDCPIGYFSSNGKCQTIICQDNYVIKNGVCEKECGQKQMHKLLRY
ncbi:Insulin-like growth factor binding protein, N-terminal [Pseudocohnilembus persalinus]|uniref:Insulin-like growth factor binding protein, N-terminal n=1 Tax=Pseudocohnilembus persalinus TaxID=266149 RepID=A0A0V0Q8T6_PSEPJ|nr:Insulin-like growth factor binding protein, N-terminal [Pseudocohnilembus persalinus]|eukprot:KRW98598.1 Insulin-like growth factor binding protein, N-terminal [Pseudocohnilembus persalinus]